MRNSEKWLLTIIILSIIIILISLFLSIPDQSSEVYRLTCENAKNINEYTSCVRFDTKINN